MDAGDRKKRCCSQSARAEIKAGPGRSGGRSAVGGERWGGRAETAERIAGGAEMIIAGPGPELSEETQVTAGGTALDQGHRGNNNKR